MRNVIIGIITILLMGCSSDPHSVDSRIERAELVKVCKDGTWIAYDPLDKVYVAINQSDGFLAGFWRANVASNINTENVCS